MRLRLGISVTISSSGTIFFFLSPSQAQPFARSSTASVRVQYPTPPPFLTELGSPSFSCSPFNPASYLVSSVSQTQPPRSAPCATSLVPSGTFLFHSLVTSVVPLMQSVSFLPSHSSFSVSKSSLLARLVAFCLSCLHFYFSMFSCQTPMSNSLY